MLQEIDPYLCHPCPNNQLLPMYLKWIHLNLDPDFNLHLHLNPDSDLSNDIFEYKLVLQKADQRSAIRIQPPPATAVTGEW